MGKTLLGITAASLLALLGASPGFAGAVNCGIINKDLAMGRTPEDISERMMISVEEIKKCEAEAKAGAAAPAAAEKPAGDGGAAAHDDGHDHDH